MLEQTRRTQQLPGPGGGDNIFAPVDNPGTVTVSHGHLGDPFPVAGMTVGQIRRRLRVHLDIDPQSTGIINGNPVDEDTVVTEGQALTFVHHVGEKGAV